MGGSEMDTTTKGTKVPAAAAAAGAQEQPPASSSTVATPTVYPDWSGFQSKFVPPGFFHSSPQAHPYMWGPQHLMPPYGTPLPPYVMYPHGVYAHPSIPPGSHPFSPYAVPSPNSNAEASGAVAGCMEVDGKSSDGKEKSPIKRSKGSLGSLNMITGKNNNELCKTSGASTNGGSQSGESGSEGSSEGSDANSQNDSQQKSGGQDSLDGISLNGTAARGSQNGLTYPSSQTMLSHPMPIMPMPAVGAPVGVGGPTRALNIGMEYWGAPTPSSILPVRGKVPTTTTVAGAVIPGGLPGSREPPELWLQDERELKRQRRKQSNRESARRSRLRKQAECEELAQRVEVMKEENTALRAEVDRVRKEHDQLLAQNLSLKERLGRTPRGTKDARPERNDKQSGDGTQRSLDSNAQAGKESGL